jgi:hypothetical protein
MKLHTAFLGALLTLAIASQSSRAQCYHEPQVRYILADISLGGSLDYYRPFAKEGDPDSARAIKEWQTGARLRDSERFERKTVEGRLGKGIRIVYRGTNRTVPGAEIRLTTDLAYEQAAVRLVLLDLALGAHEEAYRNKMKKDANVAEALGRWQDKVRPTNAGEFEIQGQGAERRLVYKGADRLADGMQVKLNSDVAYEEADVRYLLADMCLGGSPDFYRRVVDTSHDPISIEALARFEDGYKVTNLDSFERKKVAGKTLVTYKSTDKKVKGSDIKLSSDRVAVSKP